MLLFFVEKYTQQRITKEVLNTDKSLGYIILREKDNQVNVIWEERIDISSTVCTSIWVGQGVVFLMLHWCFINAITRLFLFDENV